MIAEASNILWTAALQKPSIFFIQWINIGNFIIIDFYLMLLLYFRDLSNNGLGNLPPYIFKNITAVRFL